MIDYIQSLHNVKNEEKEMWLGELNDRLIPIRISFNGEQSLDTANDSFNCPSSSSFSSEVSCLLRIIHSGFFNTKEYLWQEFLEFVKGRGGVRNIAQSALHNALASFFKSAVSEPIF